MCVWGGTTEEKIQQRQPTKAKAITHGFCEAINVDNRQRPSLAEAEPVGVRDNAEIAQGKRKRRIQARKRRYQSPKQEQDAQHEKQTKVEVRPMLNR